METLNPEIVKQNIKQTVHPTPLRTYRYRYVCLAIFFLAALLNSFSNNTLTASAFTVERLYDQPRSKLALCSLADNLLMPLLVFPASYLLDHVGLKTGLNFAALAMCFGQLLRLYI